MSADGYDADGYQPLSSRGSDESTLSDLSGNPAPKVLFTTAEYTNAQQHYEDQGNIDGDENPHGGTSDATPDAHAGGFRVPVISWIQNLPGHMRGRNSSSWTLFDAWGRPSRTPNSAPDNLPIPSSSFASGRQGIGGSPQSAPATVHPQASLGQTPVSDVTQHTLDQHASNTSTRGNTQPGASSSDSNRTQSHSASSTTTTSTHSQSRAGSHHVPVTGTSNHADPGDDDTTVSGITSSDAVGSTAATQDLIVQLHLLDIEILKRLDKSTLRKVLSTIPDGLATKILSEGRPLGDKTLQDRYRILVEEYTNKTMPILAGELDTRWQAFDYENQFNGYKAALDLGPQSYIKWASRVYTLENRPWKSTADSFVGDVLYQLKLVNYQALAKARSEGRMRQIMNEIMHQFMRWIYLPTVHYAGYATFENVFLTSYVYIFITELVNISVIAGLQLANGPNLQMTHVDFQGFRINCPSDETTFVFTEIPRILQLYTSGNPPELYNMGLQVARPRMQARLCKKVSAFYGVIKYITDPFRNAERVDYHTVQDLRRDPRFDDPVRQAQRYMDDVPYQPSYMGSPINAGAVPPRDMVPFYHQGDSYMPTQADYIDGGRAVDVDEPRRAPFGRDTHLVGRWVHIMTGHKLYRAWERYPHPLTFSELPRNVLQLGLPEHWVGRKLPDKTLFTEDMLPHVTWSGQQPPRQTNHEGQPPAANDYAGPARQQPSHAGAPPSHAEPQPGGQQPPHPEVPPPQPQARAQQEQSGEQHGQRPSHTGAPHALTFPQGGNVMPSQTIRDIYTGIPIGPRVPQNLPNAVPPPMARGAYPVQMPPPMAQGAYPVQATIPQDARASAHPVGHTGTTRRSSLLHGPETVDDNQANAELINMAVMVGDIERCRVALQQGGSQGLRDLIRGT